MPVYFAIINLSIHPVTTTMIARKPLSIVKQEQQKKVWFGQSLIHTKNKQAGHVTLL